MTGRGLVLAFALVSLAVFVAVYLLTDSEEPRLVTVESPPTMPNPVVPVTTTTAPELIQPAPPPAPSVSEPAPPPKQKEPVEAASSTSATWGIWDELARCESSGRWHYDGLHKGGLQWLPATWTAARKLSGLDVPASAVHATREQEIRVAQVWLAATSPRQWPTCGPRVGLTMAAVQVGP